MLGLIFRKAQNKIQDPAKLRQLIVDLIGKETWLSMTADVKGDAYEGLLERNAQDVKGGAGQYFTPRPLIDAMVECIQPKPGEVIATRPAAPAASCSPPTVPREATTSSTRTRRSTSATRRCAASSWSTACPPVRDEPVPARRRPRRRRAASRPGHRRRAAQRAEGPVPTWC
jgi:hypothetical protein